MVDFHNWVRETSIECEEKLSRALKPEEIKFLRWVEEQFVSPKEHT